MRRFKVKVNDEEFEVEVEEVGAPSSAAAPVVRIAPPPAPVVPVSMPAAPRVAPATPAAPAPTAAAPKPAPAAAAPAPASSAGNGEAVRAPIPGVVSAIKVSSGAKVAKGEVLLLLEAMKMQNEILAPFDATVSEIPVSQGASVQTGDVLVTLRH